jgi:CBS domain-containing protein
MTVDVATCRPDQTVASAAYKMADLQIRRLPVLDADGLLVGMLSLGDIANDASEEIAGQTLGEIVEAR